MLGACFTRFIGEFVWGKPLIVLGEELQHQFAAPQKTRASNLAIPESRKNLFSLRVAEVFVNKKPLPDNVFWVDSGI